MSDPRFTAPVVNPFGLANVGVSARPTFADMDGDGDLDAFVGERFGNIRFFRNTGTALSPSFAAETGNFGLAHVGNFSAPTLADIDGDGDLDAFVGEFEGTTKFFLNTGTASAPSFLPATSNFGLADVGFSATPTFADIDGDGDLDAFVGEFLGTTKFFLNTGTASAPSFLPATSNFGLTDVGFYATPTFADLDGDGDLDAFVGEGFGNTRFFRNTGTALSPRFVAETGNFGLTDVGYAAAPTFADIDGDGDLDAFIGQQNGNTFFFQNHQAPNVTITPGGNAAVTEGGAGFSYSVVLDSQPTADVTLTLDNTNHQVDRNVITLTFTAANWNVAQTVTLTAVDDTVGEGAHRGVIKYTVTSTDADYNGFTVKPLQVAISDNDLPTGDPVFIFAGGNPSGLADVGYAATPTFADIDGDGDLDVFIGEALGNTRFFRNTGTAANPSFVAEANNFGLAKVAANSAPTFADIDGDGDLDAFIGGLGSPGFFRNTGTATSPSFAAESGNFGLSGAGTYARPAFADLDGDGDLDALVGNNLGNTLLFRNNGSATQPSFVSENSNFGLTDVGSRADPTLADLDGDGDLDALIGNSAGSTVLFRNTGTASSPNFVQAAQTFGLDNVTSNASPSLADLDGDGDLDAWVGNGNGDILYFENTVNLPVLTAPAAIAYTDTKFNDVFAPANGQLTATDANGDTLTFGIAGGADLGNGTVSVGNVFGTLIVNKSTGAYTFTAQDDAIESLAVVANLAFTVTVTDGTDTVGQTLALDITQSGATETNGNDVLTGTAGNDSFDGLAGNDTLNGLGGADTMLGGLGNDIYVVDNAGDIVIELSALTTEIDRVISTVSYVLTANVENLTLTGTNEINGTGNQLKNALVGNNAANVLNGGSGVDRMTGGLGNDTYIVDNIGDNVIETSTLATEIDRVLSTISYTLKANVETLILRGANNINGTGNTLNNNLLGNNGNNILNGLEGNDIMTGGLGRDIFRLTTLTRDRITDFNVADDTIQLENGVFTQLTTTGVLSANNFTIGVANDADDYLLYNSANGILTYDSNGNGAGGATQIAVLGIGLTLTNADFGVI